MSAPFRHLLLAALVIGSLLLVAPEPPMRWARERYLSRRESRRSLRIRPSVWQCGQ